VLTEKLSVPVTVSAGEDVTTLRRGRRLVELARLAAPLLACGGFSLLTAPARADRAIAEHFSLLSDGHSLRAPPR